MQEIDGNQLRATLALLHWPCRTLAERAGLDINIAFDSKLRCAVERQTFAAYASTVQKVVDALHAQGIVFDRGGVYREERRM